MTDLVAEIESVFDEIPNDKVAAASTLSVSSQPDNRIERYRNGHAIEPKELKSGRYLLGALSAKLWKLV